MTETIDAERVYIADESFSSPHGDVTRDDRLLGSHIIVATYPAKFSPDGTLPADRGSDLAVVMAKREADDRAANEAAAVERATAAKNNPVKLKIPDVVVAQQDVIANVDGLPATIQRGSVVFADSDLALEHPDVFKPPRSR